ncbi:MAG TPA: methyltransferase domain-containing protein [Candidatus Sumerlaeota bacterium]|nr:methyltransferase domain-containing protein [Candidatus Sumerlaeota bacterium]
MKPEVPKTEPPQRGKNAVKPQRKVLGPVPNLEEHVRSDWWNRIFNSLYLKTDADVVDDNRITRQEIDRFIEILKLTPEHKILDLCCGQGRHSMELARRGFNEVEGLDRSHYLIQRAKTQARKESLKLRFKEGDARKLPYPADTFDTVMILGNSFGYFDTIHDDLRVLKEVFRLIKPWGRILIDVADGDFIRRNFEARSWEWIDKKYFVCRERSLSVDQQRLISREVITHVDKGVMADQFYAERLYTADSIIDLLKDAGFVDVEVNGGLVPESQRNQDLGMMAQRIVVTGVVRKEWTPVRKKVKAGQINVAVVMGDPSKPDPLKPQAIFDEDDFYTIDQLKAALKRIPEYNCTFVNSHDNLVQELQKMGGKVDIVFNLCDEGFLNNPKLELHIPALLEVAGIPYTGAGPQCLAFCYDKSLVRGVAKEMEIPVPVAFFVKPEDTIFGLPFVFPLICKPNIGDSSFGITQKCVANNTEELANAISEIRQKFGYDKPILVEEFLVGKDLSLGIIGNPPEDYLILPIIEEDYSRLPEGLPRICGYEAKWLPDSPYWTALKSIPADLDDDTEKNIVECSLKLFERLECRDYARFDWRLNKKGHPKLLEVNPNPGWCWDGHLAKMAAVMGISYDEMIKMILNAAAKRLKIG